MSSFFCILWTHNLVSPSVSSCWTGTEQFKGIEDATGYPAAWFLVAAVVVALGFLAWIGGSKLLIDLLGFVYPAYMSFKSMDTNSGDDTQWLTYWICFSALSIVETMLSFVTALIPMYFWIKIAIIVVRCFCLCGFDGYIVVNTELELNYDVLEYSGCGTRRRAVPKRYTISCCDPCCCLIWEETRVRPRKRRNS